MNRQIIAVFIFRFKEIIRIISVRFRQGIGIFSVRFRQLIGIFSVWFSQIIEIFIFGLDRFHCIDIKHSFFRDVKKNFKVVCSVFMFI